MSLTPLNAVEAKRLLDRGEAILIDVRESDEHAREHIIGARLAPLSAIDAHDFDRDHQKTAIFHCRSGMRTQTNAAKLLAKGFARAHYLESGLEGWKGAGLPVHTNHKAPIDIMRQVQMIAGSIVLLGLILGSTLHPAFFALSAFMGGGLLFAGATGWCGLALLLKAAPWNRVGLASS